MLTLLLPEAVVGYIGRDKEEEVCHGKPKEGGSTSCAEPKSETSIKVIERSLVLFVFSVLIVPSEIPDAFHDVMA